MYFQNPLQHPRCLCFRKSLRPPGRSIDNQIDQTGGSPTGTSEFARLLPAGGSYPSGPRCPVCKALGWLQNHLTVPLKRLLASARGRETGSIPLLVVGPGPAQYLSIPAYPEVHPLIPPNSPDSVPGLNPYTVPEKLHFRPILMDDRSGYPR